MFFHVMRRVPSAVLPLLALGFLLAQCGGGSGPGGGSSGRSGPVLTTISDPPTCAFPAGSLRSVWITVTGVRAHIDSGADSNAAGWQDLTPGLSSAPMQIDLLASPSSACTLGVLGSTAGLPAGRYQQIRFLLLSNNPVPGTPAPGVNNCGAQGFNCLVLADGSIHRLELSSQDLTGIKIPPGRIASGGIMLEAGQSADINIDFNACASIVRQGNSRFRLLPTLHAGEVSAPRGALTGRVVDTATGSSIVGGTIIVAAEQPDAQGIDRIIMQTRADANTGTFSFCPLPEGTYDIVATGVSASGATYHATIALGVAAGTAMGDLPLVPVSGASTAPATLTGTVTSSTGTAAATADVALSALQTAIPASGSPRDVTVPLLGDSTVNVATTTGGLCPASAACATFTLLVPGGNPSVGTFASTGTTFAAPAGAPVNYKVSGRATTCSPAEVIVTQDSAGGALVATAGTTTNVQTINLVGCQAGS